MKKISLALILILTVSMIFVVSPGIQPVLAAVFDEFLCVVDGYSDPNSRWLEYGSSPYLHNYEGSSPTDYVTNTASGDGTFYCTFDDAAVGVPDNFDEATLYLNTRIDVGYNYDIKVSNDSGSTWYDPYGGNIGNTGGVWVLRTFDVSDYFWTKTQLDNAEFQVHRAATGGVGDYIDYAAIGVPGMIDVEADLEDIDDDGADWVFTEWKYYNFTVNVNTVGLENVSMRFDIQTAEELISCGFFTNDTTYGNGSWIYASNMTYESREGEPVLLKIGSWSEAAGVTTVIFPIWFTDRCLDVYNPLDAKDIWVAYNSSDYEITDYDFFRIYNDGGFSLNTESSDSTYGYLMSGGSPFSFHVADDGGTDNQWMYNEIWSRDAIHLKLLPEIHFLTGADDFAIFYGADYSTGGGEWLTGFWLAIQPDTVHYNGLFTSAVWINMTLTFNDRYSVAITGTPSLYMYNHGSITGNGDPGWWEIWVDLWFSDKNSSRIGAARCNAYEFPMEDSADLWLRWLANNWAPIDDELKEMRGESELIDTNNDTMSTSQIKMIRYWSNVTVYSAGGGQIIEIPQFDTFDFTHSRELPPVGISDPVFDETIVPVVGSKGLLGALWTMFSSLGSFLSENIIFGGLNLWGNFVNFLDTIAAWFGAPKFFTNLFNWFADVVGYLGNSILYIGDILTALFSLFGQLMASFLTTVGDLIASLVNFLTTFLDMMGGAYGVGVDLWDTFNVSQWLVIAMIFYPLYLVILWDQEGMDAVITQLTWIFGLLSWIFGFLVSLIQFVIGLITSVIESIPIAE